METAIAKWGNSLALRLPKAVVDSIGWQEGDTLDITQDDRQLVLKKIRKIKRYALHEVLDSFHTAQEIQHIDFGEPQGKELW